MPAFHELDPPRYRRNISQGWEAENAYVFASFLDRLQVTKPGSKKSGALNILRSGSHEGDLRWKRDPNGVPGAGALAEAPLQIKACCKSPDVGHKVEDDNLVLPRCEPQPASKLLNEDASAVGNALEHNKVHVWNVYAFVQDLDSTKDTNLPIGKIT